MKKVITLIVIILVILILIITPVAVLRYVGLKRQQEVRLFIEEVVESINDQTDFYKKHAEKRAISGIERHIGSITDNYEVLIVDYDWGTYDYRVAFDNNNTFRVKVVRDKDVYIVINFSADY